MLHVHQNTIYKLIDRQEVPYIKRKGVGIRFRKEEIEEWLNLCSVKKYHHEEHLPMLNISLDDYDRISLKGRSALSKKSKRWNYGFGTIYVRTFKGKSRFCVDYKDHSGKRIRHVIPDAQTREEAVLYLRSRVAEAFDTKNRTRRRGRIRFDSFATIYMEDYAKVNKKSWKTDEYRLQEMVPFFGKFEIRSITPLDIEKFRAKRLEAGNSKSTTNRFLTLLKKMINLAIDWGYLDNNPATKVKMFAEHDNLKEKVLSDEEEQKLLYASPDHLRPIIIMALNTGMRRGEILNLKWQDVDFERRIISVKKTKSGRTRSIPINDSLLNILEDLDQNGDKVFPYTYIQTAFQNSRRRAGLHDVRFHDLRHTFASRLVANGVDIVTVQQLLGHQSITTTERYTHSNIEQKRKAVGNLTRICHVSDIEDPDLIVNRSKLIN